MVGVAFALGPMLGGLLTDVVGWRLDDVVQLMAIIENEDVDDYLMLQLMRAAKNDETISADEFRKEIKKWK